MLLLVLSAVNGLQTLPHLHLALVDVDLAVDPREPRLALAVVGVDGVDALAAVLAGVAEALVKVVVAVVAGEAGTAVAIVAAHGVLGRDSIEKFQLEISYTKKWFKRW